LKRGGRPSPIALSSLEETSPSAFRIKNTFIESVADLRSPSLEHFYRERAVHTCPSKHVGRMAATLAEATGTVAEADLPSPPPAVARPRMVFGDAQATTDDHLLGRIRRQPQTCRSIASPPNGTAPFFLGPFPTCAPQAMLASSVVTCSGSATTAQHGNRCAVLSLSDALERDVVSGPLVESHKGAPHSQPQYGDFGGEFPIPTMSGNGFSGTQKHLFEAQHQYQSLVPVYMQSPSCESSFSGLELPSMGSAAHSLGTCKPCAFLHTKGCNNGLSCKFCHLCGPDVRKSRRQEKLHWRHEARKARKSKAEVKTM